MKKTTVMVEKGFALSGFDNFDPVTPGGDDPSDW